MQARSLRGRKFRHEQVPRRGRFFALLRRIVALRNEKEWKNGPLWCFRSRNLFYRADSQPGYCTSSAHMMVNIVKSLEISIFRICSKCQRGASAVFGWISRPSRHQMFSAFAMRSLASVATATLSVTSRHDDHDLSPKTLRPRAISGLA